MYTIIQDFAKIINSRISKALILYFGLILSLILGFVIGRAGKIIVSKPPLSVDSAYTYNSTITASGTESMAKLSIDKSYIFGSSKGKYYYYKGCGGNTISPKNLVYYKSESEAESAGKIIYNKCK